MSANRSQVDPFKEGEDVILVEGTYPGTRGTFLNVRHDPNWADIRELNGLVRSHPVAWLAHWNGTYRGRMFGGEQVVKSELAGTP